jgi:hypothetical protein
MPTDLMKQVGQPVLSHDAMISEEDAIPHPAVEVVSDEERRHQEQMRPKAKVPETLFRTPADPPLVAGAEVDCSVLLGFLNAFEEVSARDCFNPILSAAKIAYEADPPARLLVEAFGTNLWAMASLDAVAKGVEGFVALVPIRRAVNVLKALQDRADEVVVGVDHMGVGMGPYRVPFAGKVADFPVAPAIRDWEVRAALPATYLDEICDRILPVQRAPTEPALRGVMLHFEVVRTREAERLMCVALASDGRRLHCLTLPQMAVETRFESARPPAVVVSESFFRYLKIMVNREWAALEISEEQILGRGQDFVIAAKATMRGQTMLEEATHWRNVALDYPGHWMVDKAELVQLLQEAKQEVGPDAAVRLQFDALTSELVVSAESDEGDFADSMSGHRVDDCPAVVDVYLDGHYLSDAIRACRGGLIRFGFPASLADQRLEHAVIKGEDDRFKAVIAPLRDDEEEG